MAEIQTTHHRRRRRRSRKHRSEAQHAGWGAFLRGARFGRLIFAGMVLAAVGYAGLALHFVQGVGAGYGPLVIGMSEAEVRAKLGTPESGNDGNTARGYLAGGSRYQVTLPGGRLAQITCTDIDPQQSTCPAVLGVRIGASEGDVLRAFGPADKVKPEGRETLRQLTYSGLGFEFFVQRGEVVAISHIAPGGLAAQAQAAIWKALP